MKTFSLKTPLLLLSVATVMSLTACGDKKDDNVTPVPANEVSKPDTPKPSDQKQVNYTGQIAEIAKLQGGFDDGVAATEYAKIKANVAPKSQEMIGQWIADYTAAKSSGATAVNGTAGVLTYKKGDEDKERVLDANGFEINQMVKKGLMGSYHLHAAQKEVAMLGQKDNQAVLESVTALLLAPKADCLDGDKSKGCTTGNELKKYLLKYPELAGNVSKYLKYAEAHKDEQERFNGAIKGAVKFAEQSVAQRAVYYFETGTEKLADDAQFASAVHSISEGLGMMYSLQYGDKYTESEVAAFLGNLNLYNKADAATRLKAQSTDIQTKYGFTYEKK